MNLLDLNGVLAVSYLITLSDRGYKIAHRVGAIKGRTGVRSWSETREIFSAREGNAMTISTRPGLSDNAAGAISYLTFIPAFVFLVLPPFKGSPYVRFHAWQSVLLYVSAFVVEIIFGGIALLTLFLSSPILAHVVRVISLVWLVLLLICVIQAMNGKRFRIPLLGNIAEKLSMK